MIKGNGSLLLEYEQLDQDIEELKLMLYNDNLSKHYIIGLGNSIGEGVLITFVYEGFNAYKFMAVKTIDGLLITQNAKCFRFTTWEDEEQ